MFYLSVYFNFQNQERIQCAQENACREDRGSAAEKNTMVGIMPTAANCQSLQA